MQINVDIKDPLTLAYIEGIRRQYSGIGRTDVIRLALTEFMVNHPLDSGNNGRTRAENVPQEMEQTIGAS